MCVVLVHRLASPVRPQQVFKHVSRDVGCYSTPIQTVSGVRILYTSPVITVLTLQPVQSVIRAQTCTLVAD